MSAQPAAGGKICFVCGTDVAKKPRSKDERGRYMCQGMCEQAARERARAEAAGKNAARPAAAKPSAPKPPPVAAESNDYDMMANLLDSSPAATASACPGCGAPMMGGAVVCMSCGYNQRIGKAAKTKVLKTPKASQMPTPRRRERSGEFGPSFGVLALISLAFFGGMTALGMTNQLLLGLAMLVVSVGVLGGYIWSIVSAFRSDNAKMGIFGLLCVVPIVNLISLVFVFWALTANPDKWSRAIYTGAFLSYIVIVVVVFTRYGGFEGFQQAVEQQARP